ncbi:hypothetical protein acsn021_35680 [Anaerocolumna cellulosilytica]|uniref:Uncharacterized protein n=1 Tax=Anaerocolumna cellulosilytica TaxID=433286 RepID=A0A6S6R3R2_9FIRM|nr:MarR family transcriptional regulator [Anaerocolumna cellulosilytica]MBB5195466.1 DNA-binding MarR family transcriptional regulator [Anaerocolumna cellulosilytica]BCJ95999.1 hypothetical protein acsn021_35680 [Anaerocolumna cellulosilytica]
MKECEKPKHPDDYGIFIKKLGKNIKYLSDENLVKHGITLEQVKILRFLTLYYSESPAYQKDIEQHFEIKRSSVTNILQNMERNGLITRIGDALDARVKKVLLTEKGKELSISLVDYIIQLENIIVQGMSEDEKRTFKDLLKRSLKNVEEYMC